MLLLDTFIIRSSCLLAVCLHFIITLLKDLLLSINGPIFHQKGPLLQVKRSYPDERLMKAWPQALFSI